MARLPCPAGCGNMSCCDSCDRMHACICMHTWQPMSIKSCTEAGSQPFQDAEHDELHAVCTLCGRTRCINAHSYSGLWLHPASHRVHTAQDRLRTIPRAIQAGLSTSTNGTIHLWDAHSFLPFHNAIRRMMPLSDKTNSLTQGGGDSQWLPNLSSRMTHPANFEYEAFISSRMTRLSNVTEYALEISVLLRPLRQNSSCGFGWQSQLHF